MNILATALAVFALAPVTTAPLAEQAVGHGEARAAKSAERAAEKEERAARKEEHAAKKRHKGEHRARLRREEERELAERGEGSGEEEPASGMWVGLNAGGWGSVEFTDLKGAIGYVRLDNAPNIAPWTAAGLHVIDDISGPYNKSGVSALNAGKWAAGAVAFVKENPQVAAVEELNEPDGPWFWGTNAASSTNALAYAKLLETTYEQMVAAFGSKHPPLLAAYEAQSWGGQWWADLKNKAAVDGVVVHPYGGTGNRAASALGNRAQVEQAHAATGKPVYVTEVGWPTAVGQPPTGDSLQWSELQQAENIYNFIAWARHTGYVAAVTIYEYRDADDTPNDKYGVVTHAGVKKLGFYALKEAAAEQPFAP
jgi:hypothetical protein